MAGGRPAGRRRPRRAPGGPGPRGGFLGPGTGGPFFGPPKMAFSWALSIFWGSRSRGGQIWGVRGGLLRNDFFGVILTRNLGPARGEFWHQFWGNFARNFGGFLPYFGAGNINFIYKILEIRDFDIKFYIKLYTILYVGDFKYKFHYKNLRD